MDEGRYFRVLLERFREETGILNIQNWLAFTWSPINSIQIWWNWNKRYYQTVISSLQNPEIINNIHFFKSKEVEKPKRKR